MAFFWYCYNGHCHIGLKAYAINTLGNLKNFFQVSGYINIVFEIKICRWKIKNEIFEVYLADSSWMMPDLC